MITSENISENLFAFYKQIVEKKIYNPHNFSGLGKISPPDNSWPAYVLSNRNVGEMEIRDISERMKSGKYPPFWIREIEESDDFSNLAQPYGIRQINSWKGMCLEKNEVFNIPIPQENLIFERVESQSELFKWLDSVNSEVMKARKISQYVFEDLLEDDAFDFFQIRDDDTILSTLLMFNYNETIGLYLLSTREASRGKGLGKFITSRAIDYYIQKAYTKFVLHSTNLGYPLQRKLGFQSVCDYGIYWMVGKI